MVRKFDKYKENLIVVDNYIISYTTKVAEIVGNKCKVLGYYSPTTTKHINYVCGELNLEKE